MDPSRNPQLFAERLSTALHSRGMTLARVRSELAKRSLDVSVASLSYWTNGRSLPSRQNSFDIVRELEHLLELTPGYLMEATFQGPNHFALGSVINRRELLGEMVEPYELPDTSMWHTEFIMHNVSIDADSCQRRKKTRIGFRAQNDGAERWAIIVERVAKEDIEAHGDTLAPLRRQLRIAPDLTALEFSLDRPVDRGTLVVADHEIIYPQGNAPVSDINYGVTRKLKLLSLTTTFTGTAPRRGGAHPHATRPESTRGAGSSRGLRRRRVSVRHHRSEPWPARVGLGMVRSAG